MLVAHDALAPLQRASWPAPGPDDQRDLDFARKFDLPVRVVGLNQRLDPAETGVATPGVASPGNFGSFLTARRKKPAIERIVAELETKGVGKGVNYRLRDWLLSRQRFWGAPIFRLRIALIRRSSGTGRRVAGVIARPARC